MIQVYGIKTCGSVRKALALLDNLKIKYEFIDLKQHAPQECDIRKWIMCRGIQTVMNTKGTTYRKLKSDGVITQEHLAHLDSQVALLRTYPLLLKRPIIVRESDESLVIGFCEEMIVALKEKE